MGGNMRRKNGLLWLLPILVFSVLIAACGGDQETPTRVKGEAPTPDVQATLEALKGVPDVGTPTRPPVSPEDRTVVLDFLKGHDSVEQDWEQFHASFDEWREGLIVCDASRRQVDLARFAGQFGSITEAGRNLPRSPSVRALVDKLVEALEMEDRALRLLRDSWQPDDTKFFENVDDERSAALALQKEVQDQLRDLQDRTETASRQLVEGYSSELRALNESWDKFHQDYDDMLRAKEAELSSAETVEQLSRLIADFRKDIIESILSLPTSDHTRGVTDVLEEAAALEDLILRRLRNSFQKSEDTGADGEVEFILRNPALFDTFEAQVVESNGMRRQAVQELADVLETTSPENRPGQQFIDQHGKLVESWNKFHAAYDEWRQSDGGCDRSQAVAKLGGFTRDFGELASKVRALPRATFLRPLGELLVEAVEREEQALRTLRNAWRPFDVGIYEELDSERSAAGKLRRQVASGNQDLLSRYDVSIRDVAGDGETSS